MCSQESPLSRRARLVGSPPPIPRLCHRDPASGASSPPAMLSHRVARPNTWSADSSSAGAKGRAPLVDFCNRIDLRARPFERTIRTPRTASAVAHRRSSFRGWLRWSQIDGTLSSACSLERGQSGVHGSGARGPGARSPALPRAPPLAIARNGSFAPTRSTRTPPVANSWRCRLEFPASPKPRYRSPIYEPA